MVETITIFNTKLLVYIRFRNQNEYLNKMIQAKAHYYQACLVDTILNNISIIIINI